MIFKVLVPYYYPGDSSRALLRGGDDAALRPCPPRLRPRDEVARGARALRAHARPGLAPHRQARGGSAADERGDVGPVPKNERSGGSLVGCGLEAKP